MAETPDQARTRRRWITLAEFVAVAGLLIGAIGLYLNWSDRREDKAEKAQSEASASKAKDIVTLSGEARANGDALALTDSGHEISAASVRFPKALGVAPQDAMPGPTIRANWFEKELLAATDKGPDAQSGRLPVLVTVSWWDGETKRDATALYDVLWSAHGRMLQGRRLELTGFALRDRTSSVAALDGAWTKPKS